MRPIPRAIYYFKLRTGLQSLAQVVFNRHQFKNQSAFSQKFGDFIGNDNLILTSHARIAFWIILNSLSLEKDSEVLMSPINLPDMVNMILLNGLKPRFVDFKKRSLDIDLEDLERKTTSKTRVLFVTVLNGISINLEEIFEYARKKNLLVILDLTQAVGMSVGGRKLAALSDYSIYSLCDLKDVHTHRGGAIAFREAQKRESLLKSLEKIESEPEKSYFLSFVTEDLISTLLLKRWFFTLFVYPMVRLLLALNLIDLLEDLTKGKGIKIFNLNIGRGLWGGDGDLIRTHLPKKLTYRFSDMQARIGLEQLKLVQERQSQRILRARILMREIENKHYLFYSEKEGVFWKFPVWSEHVKKLKKYLIAEGIDCAPSNLPLLSELDLFKPYHQDQTPHAKEYTQCTLNLPAHYYLREEEVVKIAEVLNRFRP